MISLSIESSYVIHEDNFTETMDGIVTLLRIIKSDGNISYPPLCRSILLMSCFMIENVFWNTIKKYIASNQVDQSVRDTIETELSNKIGLRKAMDNWPQLLTNHCFDFSTEPFSSLGTLVQERNDIAHSDRVSYYSYYIDNYDGASSAYYTALESAKAIQKHFNDPKNSIYAKFEKVFSPPRKILFQRAISTAKKNSIPLLTQEEFPCELKTLEEYVSSSQKIFDNVASELFGENYTELFNDSISICEYKVNVSNYFYENLHDLNELQKEKVARKISLLLRNLTMKKMANGYGVRFGEVLPHVKLKIKRIAYKNHHGYMCMPVDDNLIVFIINTSSIELTDLVKNA